MIFLENIISNHMASRIPTKKCCLDTRSTHLIRVLNKNKWIIQNKKHLENSLPRENTLPNVLVLDRMFSILSQCQEDAFWENLPFCPIICFDYENAERNMSYPAVALTLIHKILTHNFFPFWEYKKRGGLEGLLYRHRKQIVLQEFVHFSYGPLGCAVFFKRESV